MLKKILAVLAVLVIICLGVIAMQPATFRVERSATMMAPVPVVFAQVNDFHRWGSWSPWDKLDPGMQRSYEGPVAGMGAVYTWDGNRQVGQGRMTIVESRPDTAVRIKLEFMKPFAATDTAEFAFQGHGNSTMVTWSMQGKKNFVSKALGLVMNMDKMIGGDFEKGLAQMKVAAEKESKP